MGLAYFIKHFFNLNIKINKIRIATNTETIIIITIHIVLSNGSLSSPIAHTLFLVQMALSAQSLSSLHFSSKDVKHLTLISEPSFTGLQRITGFFHLSYKPHLHSYRKSSLCCLYKYPFRINHF